MSVEVPKGLTAAERETVVRWDEDDKTVVIWSASPVVLRRLHKLGLMPASESRRQTGELHGREYRVPLADFRWGLKAKRARLSEADRRRLQERLFLRHGAQKIGRSEPLTPAGQE